MGAPLPLRPLLFVGCGGSGGKTLRITHDAILRRLRGKGWSAGMPAAWQFLWIDAPADQEGGEAYGNLLPTSSYVGLVKPATVYSTGIDETVMHMRDIDPLDLVGWRPNPQQVKVFIENAAGRFRAIGRMISIRNGSTLINEIQAAYERTTTASAMAELDRASELLGAKSSQSPMAFVVSSLAGGSGAGTFLDVADVLAIECNAADSITAILYTADVFKDVPGAAGVEGNSLAALAELLAGYWSEDERSLSVFRSQGLAPDKLTRGGISYPFLVGSKNANGVSLDTQADVFRSMGELLALLTVSDEVQESVVKFLTGNWQSSALRNADQMALQGVLEMAPTSSLGYARLGLGRERFKEYAVKRLARTCIEFLATGYLLRHDTSDAPTAPADALRSIIEENRLVFLDRCQLNQREENEQIVDALLPEDLDSLWEDVNAELKKEQGGAADASLDTWVGRYQRAAEFRRGDFHNAFVNSLNQSTTKWGRQALERLLEVVGEFVGRLGLRVTLELLVFTKGELEDVADQVIGEAEQLESNAQNWRGRIGQLGLKVGANIGIANSKMGEVVSQVTSPWYYGARAEVRRRAARVMVEFATQVVSPLIATLRAAQADFESDTAPKAGEPPQFTMWPIDEGIPDWLKPSKVEFLLEEINTYPDTYLRLVGATVSQGGTESAPPSVVARRQVTSGVFASLGQPPTSPAVRRDLEGRTSTEEFLWNPTVAGGSGEPVRFLAEFRQDQLVERAEQWVMQQGPFRDHLDESLEEFLRDRDARGEPVAGHRDRLSTFRAKLKAALAASAPLIDVDRNHYRRTHQQELDIAQLIEPLPFPTQHPARRTAEEILAEERSVGQEMDRCFTSETTGINSVGIISYFAQPAHPVVFDSVTDPIASSLRTGSADFWQWKRARRLSEFVPVSSSARRAMIRGWYTAKVLGTLNDSDTPIRVLSSAGQWLNFPKPLGGIGTKRDWPLASVLESLPLSWLAWAQGDGEEVEAYQRLLHLGISEPIRLREGNLSSDQKFSLFAYEDGNPELAKWIETGAVSDGAEPLARGDNREERLSNLRETLQGYRTTLQKSSLNGADPQAILQAPRGIDLLPEVLTELGHLINARFDQGSELP